MDCELIFSRDQRSRGQQHCIVAQPIVGGGAQIAQGCAVEEDLKLVIEVWLWPPARVLFPGLERQIAAGFRRGPV